MQDRSPPARQNPLATHGRSIHLGQSRHFDGLPMISGLTPEADIVTAGRDVSKVPKPEVEVVCPTYTAAAGLDSFGAFDVIAAFPTRRAPKWRSVDMRRAALQ
jgi:hypothetical protein